MDRNAPAKFSAAQSPTATLGRKARVAMDVAIAFAVSWKPLVKSKTRAAPTTITKRSSESFTLAALPGAQGSSRGSPVGNKWCQEVPGRGAVAREWLSLRSASAAAGRVGVGGAVGLLGVRAAVGLLGVRAAGCRSPFRLLVAFWQ
jgi:hypothetical protein